LGLRRGNHISSNRENGDNENADQNGYQGRYVIEQTT
jgi:hypothetical protein